MKKTFLIIIRPNRIVALQLENVFLPIQIYSIYTNFYCQTTSNRVQVNRNDSKTTFMGQTICHDAQLCVDCIYFVSDQIMNIIFVSTKTIDGNWHWCTSETTVYQGVLAYRDLWGCAANGLLFHEKSLTWVSFSTKISLNIGSVFQQFHKYF